MVLHLRCLLISLAVILVNCDPYVLPEDIEKCKLEDSVCMKNSVQKYVTAFVAGNPALGVEVMDVLNMDEVDFELSGLKFNLKEGKLKGLRNSVIDSVNWDSQKQRLTIDFHANTTVKGHYKADGRILILPITGDGIMKLKLRNIVVKLIMDYKLEKNADGKECAVPKKYDFEYEVKDNTHIDLTNLFNGNKELSDTTLTFMNENWKILSVEFGRPIMDGAARKIFNNAAKFLSQMPLEDISIV